jgi:hypothetical protein
MGVRPDVPRMRTDARSWGPVDDASREPRWPALVAVVAVGGLTLSLAPGLSIGPPWLFPAIVLALVIPAIVSHRFDRHHIDHVLGFLINVVVTVELIASVIRLVSALPAQRESATALLESAASIWVANILVFALWYWRLDAGGPHRRERRSGYTVGAFLFPEMTRAGIKPSATDRWSPTFLDYLFLAFNTNTAFSPTDTAVVARWAKLLMMLQSVLSLTILVVLAARAINIL